MIVYAAADLHGQLPPVPRDAELLLLAGDICPDFRGGDGPYGLDKGGVQQGAWLDHTFREWLHDAVPPLCTVVATWGNHDFIGEQGYLVPELPWILLVDKTNADDRLTRGVKVYGTPWVPGLPYWAFYGDERKLSLRADAIPEGLDVLMTHGPPKGGGGYIPTSPKQRTKYGNFDGEDVGDPTLNDAIATAKPKVVICGHIHEDRGAHSVAGVPVYNVAAVDAEYNLHSQPFTRLYEFG